MFNIGDYLIFIRGSGFPMRKVISKNDEGYPFYEIDTGDYTFQCEETYAYSSYEKYLPAVQGVLDV